MIKRLTKGIWLAAAAGLAGYAGYAAFTWARFGHPRAARGEAEAAPLLDRFMSTYDIVERHHRGIAAPAELTFESAKNLELESSRIVRAIIAARRVVLGGTGDAEALPRPLLAQSMALGWGVLAEVPGREIVMGAVTQPWHGDVTFRALPPDEFAAFDEPGMVKIVWNLRADPLGPERSVFRTETRAVATDAEARMRFRRYWSLVAPGVWLLRWATLGSLQRDAEARVGVRVERVSAR
jgi:hypothetical protein